MDFVTLRKLAARLADTTQPSAPTCGAAATRSANDRRQPVGARALAPGRRQVASRASA